jgi:hypothetical protein
VYNTIIPNKKGGSRALINYLGKEESLSREFSDYLDKESEIEGQKGYFFNESSHLIDKEAVIAGIDGNCKGLKLNEARFFSMTFDPSQRELMYLNNAARDYAAELVRSGGIKEAEFSNMKDTIMKDLLRQYAVDAMDKYAQNFNREGITGNKDIVWFGRVEKDRYWKYNNKEVQHNKKIDKQIKELQSAPQTEASRRNIEDLRKQYILESDVRMGGKQQPIREMMKKSGNNYHVHIVVSRRDRTQTKSLSPLAKARKNDSHTINIQRKGKDGKIYIESKKCEIGFNRDGFSQQLEGLFDKKFDYSRYFAETYEGRKVRKFSPEQYREKEAQYNEQRGIERKSAIRNERQRRPLTQEKQVASISKMAASSLSEKFGLEHLQDNTSRSVLTVAKRSGRLVMQATRGRGKAKYANKVKFVPGKGRIVAVSTKVATRTNPFTAAIGLVKDIGMAMARGV